MITVSSEADGGNDNEEVVHNSNIIIVKRV